MRGDENVFCLTIFKSSNKLLRRPGPNIDTIISPQLNSVASELLEIGECTTLNVISLNWNYARLKG